MELRHDRHTVTGDGITGDELLALAEPPAWHQDAACREAPLSVTWFPTGKGPNAGAEAKRICSTCLARDACLEWALEQGSDLDGIWAGTTPRDRRAMRREQKKRAA